MPKELIGLGRPPRISSDGESIPEFQAWVGWQRDMGVQVGIGLPEPSLAPPGHFETNDPDARPLTLIEHLYSDESDLLALGEWLAAFARNAEEADMGTLDEVGLAEIWSYDDERLTRNARALLRHLGESKAPYGNSIWWHPTRAAINTMIRTLRKARDAAFGRDE